MKLRGCSIMLVFAIVLLLWAESALGQTPEYEYEYYYDDETTTISSAAATSTTTTTTTRRPTTTKRNGKFVSTRRNTAQRYQYARPDVIVNLISDIYGLSSMLRNGRPSGNGQRYMTSSGYGGYSNRYSSRYGRPIDYWYTMRSDPYGSGQRRGGNSGDYYSDYSDFYYDIYPSPKNRAEAQRKGSNRSIFNFVLSALNNRRN